MGSVFISYRREDSDGQARALFQDLVTRLGRDSVFMDVDSIALGRDFRAVLQERLATCDVMLALIGRDWVDGKDKSGRRRLDNPGDFVRMEISAALKRNIPVTPLLLHGAQMPSAEQLPEDLSDLAYRNGFELSHNRWESDVQELIRRLGLVAKNDTPSGPMADTAAPARQAANKPWVAIAGVSVLAVAVGGFWYYQKTPQETLKAEKEAPSAGANTEANKPNTDAESAKANAPASKAMIPAEPPRATAALPSITKNLPASSLIESKPTSALTGFSCDVSSYGGSWAEENRKRISSDLYALYGCSVPPNAGMKPGFRGDFHTPSGNSGPWKGFAASSTVLYYHANNKPVADAIARDLSERYGHKFTSGRGGGLGVLPEWHKRTIIVHLREEGT